MKGHRDDDRRRRMRERHTMPAPAGDIEPGHRRPRQQMPKWRSQLSATVVLKAPHEAGQLTPVDAQSDHTTKARLRHRRRRAGAEQGGAALVA